MDITLLSRMLKELILVNDEVSLPGLGVFVAEMIPASFSDKGMTVNPPYRRLNFVQKESGDRLLAQMYASSNDIPVDTAELILQKTSAELGEALKEKKVVVFPSLGRLRATRENNVFFVPEEDLDIYPDGAGLEPVSLKTHVETSEEIAGAVGSLARQLNESDGSGLATPLKRLASLDPSQPGGWAPPSHGAEGGTVSEGFQPRTDNAATDNVAEPTGINKQDSGIEPRAASLPGRNCLSPAEGSRTDGIQPETVGDASEAEPTAKKERKRRFRWWVIPLVLVVLAGLALGAFYALCYLDPAFIDSILYTPEELRIINY